MTPQEMIDNLFTEGLLKPISKGRTQNLVRSAQGYCVRQGIAWSTVLAAMTDAQRTAVEESERA